MTLYYSENKKYRFINDMTEDEYLGWEYHYQLWTKTYDEENESITYTLVFDGIHPADTHFYNTAAMESLEEQLGPDEVQDIMKNIIELKHDEEHILRQSMHAF